MGSAKINEDPRIDPRIKRVFGLVIFPIACPDITRDAAVSLADFARSAGR